MPIAGPAPLVPAIFERQRRRLEKEDEVRALIYEAIYRT
jgi:hypothetical protein